MKQITFVVILCLINTALTHAQQTDSEMLKAAVETKTIHFEARQATGVRGRMVQLDPGFTLVVSPEKVTGDLPFYGRSYTATPGSSGGGLKFEFSAFDYTAKPRKKGGWDITIEPTEGSDIRSIYLTVQKTGNASLRITSNSKEGMSYTGIIKE